MNKNITKQTFPSPMAKFFSNTYFIKQFCIVIIRGKDSGIFLYKLISNGKPQLVGYLSLPKLKNCLRFKENKIIVNFSNLRGPFPQKMTKIKKNASNEVSTCSGCCCGILQLYIVCKGGLWGGGGRLNGTTINQYLGNVCRKIALLKRFNFATSKKPNSHSF